ncbi:MAG: hypothetical protein HY215_04265 [Candidatus Rokubacteria bacterium]|nr:hypothetical protein [Candidatus Rokubacteria bacterium]
MPTAPKSLRLRPGLRAEIERIAKRSRRSFSEVAQDLLEEAVRMRACPGIYFADEPAGREAKVAGTGLGVWEVIRDYLAEGGNAEKVKEALPQVGDAELKASLLYYRKYPQDIDAEIAENAALTPEAVEARFPGLLRKA